MIDSVKRQKTKASLTKSLSAIRDIYVVCSGRMYIVQNAVMMILLLDSKTQMFCYPAPTSDYDYE